MLGYLSLDIICSSKLTVFLELRSRKTVRFSEQIMSADKYPSIFSRQMKAIVYVLPGFDDRFAVAKTVANQVDPWPIQEAYVKNINSDVFYDFFLNSSQLFIKNNMLLSAVQYAPFTYSLSYLTCNNPTHFGITVVPIACIDSNTKISSQKFNVTFLLKCFPTTEAN